MPKTKGSSAPQECKVESVFIYLNLKARKAEQIYGRANESGGWYHMKWGQSMKFRPILGHYKTRTISLTRV